MFAFYCNNERLKFFLNYYEKREKEIYDLMPRHFTKYFIRNY